MYKQIVLAGIVLMQGCVNSTIVSSTERENGALMVKRVEKAQSKPARYIESTVINFDFDSYSIDPNQKKRLDRILAKLRLSKTNYLIQITGYTDDIGTTDYNDVLALNRAKQIRDLLVKNKVPTKYIALNAKGKCCYLNDNLTDEARYQNRRAEVAYLNEFFVIDYSENNVADVMKELSTKHHDKSFIIFENINVKSDVQHKYVLKTEELLAKNFLVKDKVEKASFVYKDSQVVIGIAGTHPALIDELAKKEIYGNSPQEIVQLNGTYVMRDKEAREVPIMRDESEISEIFAEYNETKTSLDIKASDTDKHVIEAKRIRQNLGFNIDDEILRMSDEVN